MQLLSHKQIMQLINKNNRSAAQTGSAINAIIKYCKDQTQFTFYEKMSTITELWNTNRNEAEREFVNLLRGFIDWAEKPESGLARGKGLESTALKPYLSALRPYAFELGIDVSDYRWGKQVMDYVSSNKEEDEDPAEKGSQAFTLEMAAYVLINGKPKHIETQALRLMLACTAARPREILQLRVKDFEQVGNRILVHFSAKICKGKNPRPKDCCLSRDAEQVVMPLLENRNKEDFAIRRKLKNGKWVQLDSSLNTEFKSFSNLINKFGQTDPIYLEKNKRETRRKYTLYSFKKFCMDQIASVLDEQATREYAGHKGEGAWSKTYFSKAKPQQVVDNFNKFSHKLGLIQKEEDIEKRRGYLDLKNRVDYLQTLLEKTAFKEKQERILLWQLENRTCDIPSWANSN